jgi:hypothetical protein
MCRGCARRSGWKRGWEWEWKSVRVGETSVGRCDGVKRKPRDGRGCVVGGRGWLWVAVVAVGWMRRLVFRATGGSKRGRLWNWIRGRCLVAQTACASGDEEGCGLRRGQWRLAVISETPKLMLFLNEWQPNYTGQELSRVAGDLGSSGGRIEWNGVEQMHWHDSKALTHVRDVTRFGLYSAPVHWVDLGGPSRCRQLPAMTELPPALATAHCDRQEWKYSYVHSCLGPRSPQICHRLRTAAEAHRPSPGIKCAAKRRGGPRIRG